MTAPLVADSGAVRLIDPQIVQARGVDATVDYASLVRFGPWDDRNYRLKAEDLEWLAPDEAELHVAIPVFFRVEMRRANPDMPRTGEAQYPRSATQIFRKLYDGYQIDGMVYQKVEYRDGSFRVVDRDGQTIEQRRAAKFLDDEVRVSTPEGSAESAVKIHPRNPDLVIAGANDGTVIQQRMYRSTNGGETWAQANNLPRQGDTCCDPTVDWSWDGRFAHAAALGDCTFAGCEVWYYRSDDNGLNWNDASANPIIVSNGNNNDKEYLHVDKFPDSPFRDNLYMTWHRNFVMQFSRSTNDGTIWSPPVAMSGAGEDGIGSDITTDRNGNVYYVWPAMDAREILVRRSTNGGATWGAAITVADTNASFDFPIPAMPTRRAWIYTSVDADLSTGPFSNSIYVAWTDTTAAELTDANGNHARIRVAFSRNGGATWTVRSPHPTLNQNMVDRFNPWLAVGPDGVVHLVFYDTQRDLNREDVDLFYTFSDDGGNTWEAPTRLTGQQSPRITDNFEWGDYNGLDVVLNDLITVYTDNRREGGGSGDSKDIYAIGLPAASACNATPSNLQAWFPFDTLSSSIAENLGPGPNGAAVNGPTRTEGLVESAWDLDGSNDYVRVSDHSTLDFGTLDLSISAWVQTTDTYAMIASKREYTGGRHLGYLFMINNSRLLLQLADANDGAFNWHAPGPNLNDGDWHHLAVTVDRSSSTGGRFYVDGHLVHTFDPSNRRASISNAAELNIGRTSGGGSHLDGKIDEVQLYNRSLSANEIAGLYEAGANGQCKPVRVSMSCTGNTAYSRQITCQAFAAEGTPPYSYIWFFTSSGTNSWSPSGQYAYAYFNTWPYCTSNTFSFFQVTVIDSFGQSAMTNMSPLSCF
ncbi:MAG: sialidase family protein [Acidobacteriota bacterium]